MAFASPSPSMDIANDKPVLSFSAAAKRATGLLLTPPNSISPNLPAQVLRKDGASPPPIQIDNDLDLQDAVEHAAAQDQPQLATVPLSKSALSGLDTAGAITPSMLAKKHLPNIILGHGPIAIRHVMACLTQSVPGFSRIPAAKARRLVVAALESRAGGGTDGNIEFEKVGWGRWDAHLKGERLAGSSFPDGKMSPPASEASSYAMSYTEPGLQIPTAHHRSAYQDVYGRSWTGSDMPAFDEGLEDMSMAEHEADKMSLDGSEIGESDSGDSLVDSAGDETEPEDWAAMGADALRKASLSNTLTSSVRRNYNLLCKPSPMFNARRPSHSSTRPSRPPLLLSKSLPHGLRPGISGSSSNISNNNPMQQRRASQYNSPYNNSNSFGVQHRNSGVSMDLDQTAQEREAIEALLRMGSM